jgi:HlyD family secretion protein
MPADRPQFPWGKTWLALAVLLVLACGSYPWSRSPTDLSRVPRVAARRTELAVSLRAAGQVESSVQTIIRCELENIAGKRGNKAATTILSLVPEGTRVRAGDVLCRLDASEYEELARLQRIVVAQARARHRGAELDHDTAAIGLRQYLEGVRPVEMKGFQGRIALASADVARLADCLEWSRRMLAKGYCSRAQMSGRAAALQRAEFDLAQVRAAFQNFRDFEIFRASRSLESEVESAKTTLNFQAMRLGAEETRLAHLEQQIARCTIRAPHDGQVILAHKPKRGVRIEEGLWVRQKQALIYLPDLSRLEVHVWLNETVVNQVRPGMRAWVRPEGFPRMLHGEVATIDPLPIMDSNPGAGPEVKCYRGRVRLAEVPPDLRLGLTADVEIGIAMRHEALAVPAQAVILEGGRHVCYVLGRDGLARRPVSLGQATPDRLEVIEGLAEGEEVALPQAFPRALPGGGPSWRMAGIPETIERILRLGLL